MSQPVDRILWIERPKTEFDGGLIDEIVLHGVTVHVEQMNDRCWWIGVYKGPGAGDPYWMGNFVTDSRGRMRFVQQEEAGIAWDRDGTHEPSSEAAALYKEEQK